jgi:hypothetical protein
VYCGCLPHIKDKNRCQPCLEKKVQGVAKRHRKIRVGPHSTDCELKIKLFLSMAGNVLAVKKVNCYFLQLII